MRNLVIKIVERHYGISKEVICTKTRKREVFEARSCYYKLTQVYTKYSLSEIGQFVGYTDHATVLNGIRSFDNLLETNKSVKKKYDLMRAEIEKTVSSGVKLENDSSQIDIVVPDYLSLATILNQSKGLKTNYSKLKLKCIVDLLSEMDKHTKDLIEHLKKQKEYKHDNELRGNNERPD
jgi:hypothetical protein